MAVNSCTLLLLLLLLLVVSGTDARSAGLSKRERMSNWLQPYGRQLPSTQHNRGQVHSNNVGYKFIVPKYYGQPSKHLIEDYSSEMSRQSWLEQDQIPYYEETQVDPTVLELIDALVTHESWDGIALRRFMESARANLDGYAYQGNEIAPEDQQNVYEDTVPPLASGNPYGSSGGFNRQNENFMSRMERTCTSLARDKWSYDHVLACNQIKLTVNPRANLVYNSQTYNFTDLMGNQVEVVQGYHSGKFYDQQVEVHWCEQEGTRCQGVFGNSRCQMEDSIQRLHYKETKTGNRNIQFGSVKIPSHCSCMLVP